VARIYLAPGERFQHAHTVESRSEILEGEVVLRRGDETLRLTTHDVVVTPPGVLEMWENEAGAQTGIECCIHCSH
jgi:mannose-6-phosphate isomerase-like protein (cupin superfamily)